MLLSIKGDFLTEITKVLQQHGFAFAIFVIGLVVGIAIKQWIIDINYRKSINARLDDKEKYIDDLKQIVHERVVKIKVDHDRTFFKKVVRYFKRSA